jgi:hypothetical protein
VERPTPNEGPRLKLRTMLPPIAGAVATVATQHPSRRLCYSRVRLAAQLPAIAAWTG